MILHAYSDGKDIFWADANGKVWNFHPFDGSGMGNSTFRLGRPNNIAFGRPQTSMISPRALQAAKSQVKPQAPSRVPFGLPRDLAIRARGASIDDLHITRDKRPPLIDPNKEKGIFLPAKITLKQKQKEKGKIGKFFDRIKEGDVDIGKIAGDVQSIVRELKPQKQGPKRPLPTPANGANPNNGGNGGNGSRGGSNGNSNKNDKTLLIAGGIGLLLVGGAFIASNQKGK